MQLILEDEGPQFPGPLRARSDIEKLRIPDAEQDLGFVMERSAARSSGSTAACP